MKRIITTFGFSAVLILVLFAAIRAGGDAGKITWTGWITDSKCGLNGMNAGHKACALACMRRTESYWVLADPESRILYKIQNQTAVNPRVDLGIEVKVIGHKNDDGTISVDSIAPIIVPPKPPAPPPDQAPPDPKIPPH